MREYYGVRRIRLARMPCDHLAMRSRYFPCARSMPLIQGIVQTDSQAERAYPYYKLEYYRGSSLLNISLS